MNSIIVLICFIIFFNIIEIDYVQSVPAVTLEQMKTSTQMIRNVCQPKFKIPDDVADGLNDRKFPDDKNVKCYVHCIFEMSAVMKKSKLNYDSALKQMDILLPEEIKDHNINALTACKESPVGIKDPCEAAYALIKCISEKNEKFVFA